MELIIFDEACKVIVEHLWRIVALLNSDDCGSLLEISINKITVEG